MVLNRTLASAAALTTGLQFAMLSPLIALLLVDRFAATPAQVGLILGLSNVVAFGVSFAIPRYADATGDFRRPMLASGFFAMAGVAGLALAPGLDVAAVALVVCTGPAAVGVALLWGYLRVRGADARAIVSRRSLFSLAWVIAPPLAALQAQALGAPSTLVTVAVLAACGLVLTWNLVRPVDPVAEQHRPPGPEHLDRVLVFVVAGAFALLQACNRAVVSVMALYVSERLGQPVVWSGILLAVAAALEIPALLVLARLTSRVPARTLILFGCAAGVAYYAGMAMTSELAVALALQVFNAASYAVVAGVGLTWFAELIPGAAFSAGVYANTLSVGSVLSGGLIAVASVAGYAGVFAASGLVCGLVLVAVWWASTRTRQASEASLHRHDAAFSGVPRGAS